MFSYLAFEYVCTSLKYLCNSQDYYVLLCVWSWVKFKMCGKVKNTSIVPFTAGSGINYSGEYNSTGGLEIVDFSKFFF